MLGQIYGSGHLISPSWQMFFPYCLIYSLFFFLPCRLLCSYSPTDWVLNLFTVKDFQGHPSDWIMPKSVWLSQINDLWNGQAAPINENKMFVIGSALEACDLTCREHTRLIKGSSVWLAFWKVSLGHRNTHRGRSVLSLNVRVQVQWRVRCLLNCLCYTVLMSYHIIPKYISGCVFIV